MPDSPDRKPSETDLLSKVEALVETGLLNFGEDVNLYRSAANVLQTDDSFQAGGHIESAVGLYLDTAAAFIEMAERASDAAAPAVNRAVIYVRDTGGKTQLCVRFNTGAVQVLATEP